jgi:hypothetical protein
MALTPVGCAFGGEQIQHESFSVQCSSHPSDAKDRGLRRATLKTVDDGLEVTWTTARPKTDATYWIKLTDDYGVMRRQLSVSYNNPLFAQILGSDYSLTVDDRLEGSSEPDGEAEVRGSSVRAVFPRGVIDPPEGRPPFYWYAGLDVNDDGIDVDDETAVDTCPDPHEGDDWPIPPLGPIPPQN